MRQRVEVKSEWPDADDSERAAARLGFAIEAAQESQLAWRNERRTERSAIMRKLNDLMLADADDLALIMTCEHVRHLAEARGEIAYTASDAGANELALTVQSRKFSSEVDAGVIHETHIDARPVAKIEEQIADPCFEAAPVLTGGSHRTLGRLHFEPTVSGGDKAGIPLTKEEPFGPLVPFFGFNGEVEVIALSNNLSLAPTHTAIVRCEANEACSRPCGALPFKSGAVNEHE